MTRLNLSLKHCIDLHFGWNRDENATICYFRTCTLIFYRTWKKVITTHGILWNVLTCTCPMLAAPQSSLALHVFMWDTSSYMHDTVWEHGGSNGRKISDVFCPLLQQSQFTCMFLGKLTCTLEDTVSNANFADIWDIISNANFKLPYESKTLTHWWICWVQ